MSSPKYKIGRATERTNFIRPKELVPGPGYYEQRSRLGLESPHYSMAPRRDSGAGNGNPGPSDYAVNDSLVRGSSPGKTIPKAERGPSANHDSQPGPGHYDDSKKDQIQYQHLSYSVPQGDRLSPLPRDRVMNPGPGTYDGRTPFGKDGIHVSILNSSFLSVYHENSQSQPERRELSRPGRVLRRQISNRWP